MTLTVEFPYRFEWRDYQKDVWDAFFNKNIRKILLLWHRRAGKTITAINIFSAAACREKGVYYYLFPTREQAKRIIWEGASDDGQDFIEYFPPGIISKIDNQNLSIHFINGSILRLMGTALQSHSKLRGDNPKGVIYDEFAQQDPAARRIVRPSILKQNGFEIFITTPFGHNHVRELWNNVQDNAEWFAKKLTIEDTAKYTIFTQDDLDKERIEGVSEDFLQQEYFCSFDASKEGAYFADAIRRAYDEGRVRDFPVDPALQVYTFWDLGNSDSTVIWFVQFSPDINRMEEVKCVDYYEDSGKSFSHYINVIKDFRDRYQVSYGGHYLPHDGNSRRGVEAITYVDEGRKYGVKFNCLTRVTSKQTAIDWGRATLPKVIFSQSKCARGLECLRSYRKHFNSNTMRYENKPLHDWASDAADAFLALSQFVHDYKPPTMMHNYNNNQVLGAYGL